MSENRTLSGPAARPPVPPAGPNASGAVASDGALADREPACSAAAASLRAASVHFAQLMQRAAAADAGPSADGVGALNGDTGAVGAGREEDEPPPIDWDSCLIVAGVDPLDALGLDRNASADLDARTEGSSRADYLQRLVDEIATSIQSVRSTGNGRWQARLRLESSLLSDTAVEIERDDGRLVVRLGTPAPDSYRLMQPNLEELKRRLERRGLGPVEVDLTFISLPAPAIASH